jgi:hypothetical protein
MMRDLLRRFRAPSPWRWRRTTAARARCPAAGGAAYPETRAYGARILGLMGGAGEVTGLGAAGGLVVRLVL